MTGERTVEAGAGSDGGGFLARPTADRDWLVAEVLRFAAAVGEDPVVVLGELDAPVADRLAAAEVLGGESACERVAARGSDWTDALVRANVETEMTGRWCDPADLAVGGRWPRYCVRRRSTPVVGVDTGGGVASEVREEPAQALTGDAPAVFQFLSESRPVFNAQQREELAEAAVQERLEAAAELLGVLNDVVFHHSFDSVTEAPGLVGPVAAGEQAEALVDRVREAADRAAREMSEAAGRAGYLRGELPLHCLGCDGGIEPDWDAWRVCRGLPEHVDCHHDDPGVEDSLRQDTVFGAEHRAYVAELRPDGLPWAGDEVMVKGEHGWTVGTYLDLDGTPVVATLLPRYDVDGRQVLDVPDGALRVSVLGRERAAASVTPVDARTVEILELSEYECLAVQADAEAERAGWSRDLGTVGQRVSWDTQLEIPAAAPVLGSPPIEYAPSVEVDVIEADPAVVFDHDEAGLL